MTPFAKMKDSIAVHDQQVADESSVRSQSEAPMHQRDCAISKQVESPLDSALSTQQRKSVPGGDAMWHSSYSSTSCRSVTPVSIWSHGGDARNEHALGTNR